MRKHAPPNGSSPSPDIATPTGSAGRELSTGRRHVAPDRPWSHNL